MEIIQLKDWTATQRLEVAKLVLNPKASQMSEQEKAISENTPPEFVADNLETAYLSAWAAWQGGKCVLSCSIGVFPIPAFHFSHDGTLERSEIIPILTHFLDAQGQDVNAFTTRLALGKWGAQHLGFHIVADGLFDMGLGSRHYFLFTRPLANSSERSLA